MDSPANDGPLNRSETIGGVALLGVLLAMLIGSAAYRLGDRASAGPGPSTVVAFPTPQSTIPVAVPPPEPTLEQSVVPADVDGAVPAADDLFQPPEETDVRGGAAPAGRHNAPRFVAPGDAAQK